MWVLISIVSYSKYIIVEFTVLYYKILLLCCSGNTWVLRKNIGPRDHGWLFVAAACGTMLRSCSGYHVSTNIIAVGTSSILCDVRVGPEANLVGGAQHCSNENLLYMAKIIPGRAFVFVDTSHIRCVRPTTTHTPCVTYIPVYQSGKRQFTLHGTLLYLPCISWAPEGAEVEPISGKTGQTGKYDVMIRRWWRKDARKGPLQFVYRTNDYSMQQVVAPRALQLLPNTPSAYRNVAIKSDVCSALAYPRVWWPFPGRPSAWPARCP